MRALILSFFMLLAPLPGAVLDFEDLADQDILTTQYISQNVEFNGFLGLVSGAIGGSLNEFELPPNSGFNVILNSVDTPVISFNALLLSFQAYFTYSGPITVTALDSNGGVLNSVTSAFQTNLGFSGDPGSSPNELIAFPVLNGAASIQISSINSNFAMDDMEFTVAATAVPEPAAAVLSGAALLVLAVRRRS